MDSTRGTMLALCLLSSLCLCSATQFDIVETDGGFDVTVEGITALRHTKEQPLFAVGNGSTRFIEWTGNFRVDDYVSEKQGLPDFRIDKTEGSTSVVFTNNHTQMNMSLWSSEATPLELSLKIVGKSVERMWIRVHATSDERVYGGGEQPSFMNLRGRVYPVWTREQGVGRNKSEYVTFLADARSKAGGDYYTTYHSQPTFVSSRRILFHLNEAFYSVLDFTQPYFHEVMIMGVPEQLFIDAAPTWPKLMPRIARLLGRQPALPDWMHDGVILGVQGGTTVMLQRLDAAQKAGIKVSGLWIQDWSGILITSFGQRLNWNWVWDQNRYPGLKDEAAKLQEKGIRVLGYINMHLTTTGSLFKEADEKGYLVKDSKGNSYRQDFGEFTCGTIDLTNNDAIKWYKGIIQQNMIDLGLSGWMADFGEYLPVDDVVLASGLSADQAHNAYPTLWAQLNREAIAEVGKLGDVMFFTRSGYSGVGRYTTLMWHGDQNVDFTRADGIASTVASSLSLSFSGVWLSHFDVGGYTTFPPMVRTPELLLRSAEYAAFTPAFRSHEGNMPQYNAQFYSSAETLKGFSKASKIFLALADYRKEVIGEAVQGILPTQRALFLHYPDDEATYDVEYQYLFGADLLVAPVHVANVTRWSVYLPTDDWVHIWSGNEHTGPATVTVDAPIGQPPVFYRKQSEYAHVFDSLRNITWTNKDES